MIMEDGNKLFYLILISTIIAPMAKCNDDGESSSEGINIKTAKENSSLGIPEGRALFSPRVDYNEWMPVGRGDPLKNDPTYDYSPPTLDRVKYWGDTNKDKKEILLLGVPSKRQSHRKENKHNFIRRSYYAHLPTRLMPPPLQTIPPAKVAPVQNPGFHNNFHYKTSYKTNNGWNYNDVKSDESLNFVSITRPERPLPEISSSSKPSLTTIENIQSSPERKPWLQELLQKEVTKPVTTTKYDIKPSKITYESFSPVTDFTVTSDVYIPTSENPLPTIFQPTIPPTSMTTDSLFSHYKQPVQPLQGPMYLIIEGHSKVKTYGLKDNATESINQHKPKIVPVSTTEDVIIKHVVAKDDDGITAKIEHLPKKSSINFTEESSPIKSLLSFLDTSLGSYFLNEVEQSQNISNLETNRNITEQFNAEEGIRPQNVFMSKSSEFINERNDPRQGRQIFDYDETQRTEVEENDEKYEETTVEPKNFEFSGEIRLKSTEAT